MDPLREAIAAVSGMKTKGFADGALGIAIAFWRRVGQRWLVESRHASGTALSVDAPTARIASALMFRVRKSGWICWPWAVFECN